MRVNMVAIEVFTSSANYKYKVNLYSVSSVIVLFFIILSIITPIVIIYNSGGFWVKNRMHVETPDIKFQYKYFLLAEGNSSANPIVCSTFSTYKENGITDDCILVKVQEIDTNNDGRKDRLKFEVQFYADTAIKSLKLLLFFNFKLKLLFQATIESIAVFDCMINQDAQKIQFIGDLELHQKGLLPSEGLYETYNRSIDLADYSLDELLLLNANRKFLARIINTQVVRQVGYSKEEPTIIEGNLFYNEYVIRYQPGLWEELKWAWIQYLSTLLVFAYLVKQTLAFLFRNRYLNSYILAPWKDK